jgi:hypothetical protein
MGWVSRLLGRRPSVAGARINEYEPAAIRADLAYEFVCKANEMQARRIAAGMLPFGLCL